MIDLIITIKDIDMHEFKHNLEEIKLAILVALEDKTNPNSVKFYYPNYAE